MNEFSRILVLSDLHFPWVKGEHTLDPSVDIKVPGIGVSELAERHGPEGVIDAIASKTGGIDPDALFVAGDVASRGDMSGLQEGMTFIQHVARRFGIPHGRVVVVPGNHDVDSKAVPDSCLAEYHRAADDRRFASPSTKSISRRGVVHVPDLFEAFPDCPTTSVVGIASPWHPYGRAVALMALADELTGESDHGLADASVKQPIDVAFVGVQQRSELRKYWRKSPRDSDVERRSRFAPSIKIAMMHHALMPHPSIEISLFGAVLDAGVVLKEFEEVGVDLVICGHKHDPRFANYRSQKPERLLDIYVCPSLQTGFAFVDVRHVEDPNYATIRQYEWNKEQVSEYALIREEEVLYDVFKAYKDIPSAARKEHVVPLLRGLSRATSVRDVAERDRERDCVRRAAAGSMFGWVEEWSQQMAADKVVFRGGHQDRQWKEHIARLKQAKVDRVLISSCRDLDYWLQAIQDERGLVADSSARLYTTPLHAMASTATLTRVLILGEDEIGQRSADVVRVVKWMMGKGIDVLISVDDECGRETHDFTVFGCDSEGSRWFNGLCVSRWETMSGGQRDLVEIFAEADIVAYVDRWEKLQAGRDWPPQNGSATLREWIKKRVRLGAKPAISGQ